MRHRYRIVSDDPRPDVQLAITWSYKERQGPDEYVRRRVNLQPGEVLYRLDRTGRAEYPVASAPEPAG